MAYREDKIRIYYQNVNGIRTKNEIRSKISAAEFEFIAFTEHWLNDDFSSSEYFDETFFVERDDRDRNDKAWGGGALIAIKNYIPYKRRNDWELNVPFDNIWIEIKSKTNAEKTFINVIYIPPRTNFSDYQKYLDFLTEVMCAREPNAKFLVMGDFNLGGSIEWFFFDNECLALSHEGNIANEVINTFKLPNLIK